MKGTGNEDDGARMEGSDRGIAGHDHDQRVPRNVGQA